MVTRDYTEDDKAPGIPMNATVTVTSSPGNQFVITRVNPGKAWSSRHFNVGGDSSLTLKNIILDGNNAMGVFIRMEVLEHIQGLPRSSWMREQL